MQPDFHAFCLGVGKRVRQLRLARDLTQEDMADRGFVVRHYQRIEAGRSVTLRTIWKLARAFGVAPRAILPSGPGSIALAKRSKASTPGRPPRPKNGRTARSR
jgi:transcriptional regulator with XRE-family HTH domain